MINDIPGLKLSELFFQQAVQPVLSNAYPKLVYSAALIGHGSEVLGFDDEMSRDHDWGPRVQLFLSEDDITIVADEISQTLSERIPHRFRGYPTSFTEPDPNDNGTRQMDPDHEGPVKHRVALYSVRGFFNSYLGFDIRNDIDAVDWLTFPAQKLRSIVEGKLFHDDIGLEAVRKQFSFYPPDVWLYLLASGWARVGQEEHLMGRAGLVGDELGSALIGSRMVRDIIRLCFLMEQKYAPYAKWLGIAFDKLTCATKMRPHLVAAISARTWRERETALSKAFSQLARLHNDLAVTEPMPVEVSSFHGRPFKVIHGERFAKAIRGRLVDPAVKALTSKPLIGNIDLISDNTDFLEDQSSRERLRRWFE